MSVAILVPVLGRPQNVAPLAKAFAETTPGHRILWICDPDDRDEQDAIAKIGGQMISPGGTYAAKLNAGVRATDDPYLVFAADDVRPQRGWLLAAMKAMAAGPRVIGLNDLIERPTRPQHATHFFVTREAAELPCIDGSPGPTFEGYSHWHCDDELIATATKRGMYAYAPDAILQHLHPMNGGAEDDDTYRKGRSGWKHDGRLFRRRSRLWR